MFYEPMKKAILECVDKEKWFDRFEAISHAQGFLEEEFFEVIEGVIDFHYDDFGFDTYDSSVEFYKVQNTGRLSESLVEVLKGLGLTRCWLNHKDGTETYYGFGPEYRRDGFRTISHKSGMRCGEKYDKQEGDRTLNCLCSRRKGHSGEHGTPVEEDLVSVDE